MNLSRHVRTPRPGFTLVELLVVIAIIAILVGLISAAVVKALAKGNEVANMADVRKMAQAHQAFTTQFKVDYIPSRIRLRKYMAHYDVVNDPVDRDSLAYLNQLWPKLRWQYRNAQNQLVHRRIDWDGTLGGGGQDVPSPPAPAQNANWWNLEGHQCLVFFLGGIPQGGTTPGTLGFSTNPADPTAQTQERVSPFFDFKSNRLRPVNGFHVYFDAYGSRPYAYFSSYGKRNGYNKYYQYAPYRNSDCAGLNTWPLAEQGGGNPRYLNPDSFQIISAGANEAFGPGSPVTNYNNGVWTIGNLWTYRTPASVYIGAQFGSDDQSNFHALMLGVPAE